ncbi:MAG: ribonuclease HII [Candidatus Omnitrophota bacterium]
MLYYENKAKKQGFQFIVGIDEAGRGPLAGPVVASAVILTKKRFRHKIQDSKTLTPQQRENAFHEIFQNGYLGVGIMNEAVIDEINILEATYRAMAQAVERLIDRLPAKKKLHKNFAKKVCLLVDGQSFRADLPYSYKTIIRGDQLSRSIACASIVAKVIRDRILATYDAVYPQYGFKEHKGYPTRKHRMALKRFGPSAIHRKTFRFHEAMTYGVKRPPIF